MHGLDAQATTIQSAARGWLARRQAGKNEQHEDRLDEKLEAESREWEARQVELKEESDERRALNEKERRSTEDKIKQLRKALAKADKDCIKTLKVADDRRSQAKKDKIDLAAKLEKAQKKDGEAKVVLKQQEAKLEETKKMILVLKKENKKVRLQYDKLLQKSQAARSDAERHLAYNENAGSNFEGLDEETTKVSEKNDDLVEKFEKERDENKRLVKLVRNMQDQYMTEAENRLKIQQGLAKILNIVQGDCKDPDIVEDAIVIALECETGAKSEMDGLDAMEEDLTETDVSDSESHSEYSY
jgi:chromosome segregation ATPase